MVYDIITQFFGILGMTMNIVSYQAKRKRNIILIQFFGSLFFTINMFMLNAYTGALLNLIGVIRALIYANKEKIKSIKIKNFKIDTIKIINILFVSLYLTSYVLTFTVFGKTAKVYNLIIEILPVIAMVSTTIAFSSDSAKTVRRIVFISSPSWFIYNCFNFAIGGMLCEAFTLISTIIAIRRFDEKEA